MTEIIKNYSKDKHKKQTNNSRNSQLFEQLATRNSRTTLRTTPMFSNNNSTVSNNADVSNVSKNGKMMKKKPPPIRYQPYINPQPMPKQEELAKIADLWENNKEGIDDYLANLFANTLKIS